MRDRDMISVAGVISVVLLLGLIRSIHGTSIAFKDVDAAAWVQAVGSVLAIAAATWISRSESRERRLAEEEAIQKEQKQRERFLQVRADLLESVRRVGRVLQNDVEYLQRIRKGEAPIHAPTEHQMLAGIRQQGFPRFQHYLAAIDEWPLRDARSAEEARLIVECKEEMRKSLRSFENVLQGGVGGLDDVAVGMLAGSMRAIKQYDLY